MKKLVVLSIALMMSFGMVYAVSGDTETDNHVVKLSIPEVALLDLEGNTSVTLTPTAPTEAGEAFDFSSATSSAVWVNYSSVVAAAKARSVSVQITDGVVPNGLTLTVVAGTDAGQGKGNVGSSAGTITLSSDAQTLISNVRSCWTGTGASKGHNLTYALDLTSEDNYGDLANADTDIEITYTISDDI